MNKCQSRHCIMVAVVWRIRPLNTLWLHCAVCGSQPETHWFLLKVKLCSCTSSWAATNKSTIKSPNILIINFKNSLKKKKVKILWLQLRECKYFPVSFLLCDSKLNIFGLWTKQDICGRRLGLWETLINFFFLPFSDILDQTTNWLTEKIINRLTHYENKWYLQP